ncbi:hypothetical protein [Acinetobacter populi]|uniref:hypothetical protein n=1 Tax=Acinetobacter populi TaxID=1582270 RepID=UPI00111F8602|nr:hypothetical protein [Acinetobacter populi]
MSDIVNTLFDKKSVSEHHLPDGVGKTLIMLKTDEIRLATGRGFFMPNCWIWRMKYGFSR